VQGWLATGEGRVNLGARALYRGGICITIIFDAIDVYSITCGVSHSEHFGIRAILYLAWERLSIAVHPALATAWCFAGGLFSFSRIIP